MKNVFDLESNGLLYDADRIHCVVIKDIVSGSVSQYTPDSIEGAIKHLKGSKMLIGHNIAQFDIVLIEKLLGVNLFNHCKIRDTYCMSKLFYPERKFTVGHSLESYGKQFGREKPVHEDWTVFSPEMMYRCTEDVEINHLLYEFLVKENCQDWDWLPALELEQEFAYWQGRQELEGVDVDVDVCNKLINDIDKEVDEIDAAIRPILPKRVKAKGGPVMKPFKKDGTYTQQVTNWVLLDEDSITE